MSSTLHDLMFSLLTSASSVFPAIRLDILVSDVFNRHFVFNAPALVSVMSLLRHNGSNSRFVDI